MSDEERRRLREADTGVAWRRPVHGGQPVFQTDPHWRDLLLFYENYHGDNGAGIGASHQTGWSGTVGVLPLLFRGSIFREQSLTPAQRAWQETATGQQQKAVTR